MFANLATTTFWGGKRCTCAWVHANHPVLDITLTSSRTRSQVCAAQTPSRHTLHTLTVQSTGIGVMMFVMSESETRAAFLTAALVLLVMPIVYVIGLASAMLILQTTPWRDMSVVMFGFAIVWGIVVLAGVLITARRLNRPSARV